MIKMTEIFNPKKSTGEQVDSQSITASGTSARIAVTAGDVLRIVNTHATQLAYLNFGSVAVTAQAGDILVPPAYGTLFVRVPQGCTHMAYFASGASTVLNVAGGF